MINVGPSTLTQVFSASFPGIYQFVLVKTGALTPGDLWVANPGAHALDMSNNNDGSRCATVYLAANDAVLYVGPAAKLAGVRLGDELFPE